MPMGEAFVRAMNVDLERFSLPRPTIFKGARNALISELSFRLYTNFLSNGLSLDDELIESAAVKSLANEVHIYISRLEQSSSLLLMEKAEVLEAFDLAKRLRDFIRDTNPRDAVEMHPKFTGCGILDDCEGDILVGKTLYELKNVERDFRLADIRQLLCYCALNFASGKYEIDTLGLVNPRAGLYYRVGLNALSFAVSGGPAIELLSDVIRYVSMDTPSR
ncbi:hypothetical protein ACO0LO_25040 [Undibacterium sp. TJN25]|uniref:hypothetical protein n=1 Tax=Undibacterium sp. TJN25 TaxID=3413056 RepID=UPI003BF34074